MAKRVRPIAKIELFAAGQEWRQKYDGFGQYDLLADMWRRGEGTVSYVDKAALGVVTSGGMGNYVPTGMVVQARDINAFICRPFLDTSQALGKNHFTFAGGTWEELVGLGIQNEVKLFQSDGSPNKTTAVETKFNLPTNPMFCVSLYRGEPTEGHNWLSSGAATEVHFGVASTDEWALIIPYGSAMYLQRRVGGKWYKVPHSERSVRLPSLEGMRKGERLFLWVAVIRGRIVVSTDGFCEEVWCYEIPGESITVRSGRVGLWHYSGQWAFSLLPIKMAQATVESPWIPAGYDTQDSTGELILDWRGNDVVNDLGIVLSSPVVTDVTGEKPGLPADVRVWRAELPPSQYTVTGIGGVPGCDFTTCTSPELYAVSMGQFAQNDYVGPVTATEITDDVDALEGEHPEDLTAAEYVLSLDNQLGSYSDLRDYRRVRVGLGWRYDDGSTDVATTFTGYNVEPVPAVEGGGEALLDVPLLDPIIRLRDEKCDGRVPMLDGWLVTDVFHWVLDRCGLPRSRQDLEDLGTRLSLGQPEKLLWQVEHGRSWLELLLEVARYDYNATIFCDENEKLVKACRYCRQKRTAENLTSHSGWQAPGCPASVDWEMYTRGSVATNPEAACEILSIERPRLTLSAQRRFANYVAVAGLGPDGKGVRGIVWDPESVNDPTSDRFVGWRKMHVEASEYYTSQALANQVATERFNELSNRPEYVEIATPLNRGLKIGQVILVKGAEELGCHNQKYRVLSVRHELGRGPRVRALTRLQGRWIGSHG